MPTTTNSALRYPSPGSAPNGPQQIQELATDVDTKMPRGVLCKPLGVTGTVGTANNGLAIATTPTITVGANRVIRLTANFQLFIPSGSGQTANVWFERWLGGSVVAQFGGVGQRVTTTDLYYFSMLVHDQITSAGSYVWKVAGAMTGGATATVDGSAPLGSVGRSATFTVADTGPIPAI